MGRKILIALIAAACAVLAFYSLRDSMRTYVPFREAMTTGRAVQIIGTLDKSVPARYFEGFYTIAIKDKDGTSLAVRHAGTRPANLEHADQVVARGKYIARGGYFEAEKILVKCPSRYAKKAEAKGQKAESAD
jgi:cytochrome c-type biogenesis protein CcmE